MVMSYGSLLVAVITITLLKSTDPCGIITHIDLAQRATEFFDAVYQDIDFQELTHKHEDALQAGAPYPDAYYPDLCRNGIFHDVSEDTHWTPFLNVSINYIRDRYPPPWDESAEKLVVFLLALTAHQISDATWHSLGIPQGFLRAMANINFAGSFGDAHGIGDFGGDVINYFELDLSYVGTLGKWYVPIDDLIEMHHEYYGEYILDQATIEDCTRLLYMGRLGEMTGALDLLFAVMAGQSPFLIDRLQDYFLGGMDDMSAMSSRTWDRVTRMLDQGTQICDLPENPIYITCEGEEKHGHQSVTGLSQPDYNMLIENKKNYLNTISKGIHWDDVIVERTERGVQFKPSERIIKLLEERQKLKQVKAGVDGSKKPASLYGTQELHSRLGHSLLSADVNNDGFSDLVIGAPGYGNHGNHLLGRVYIIYGSAEGLPAQSLVVEEQADVILQGIEENGKFGTALAMVDLNADGFSDLVVSAPQVGAHLLNYQGEVYVFFGHSTGLSENPNVTISCGERFCNLGVSLAGSDVNGDGSADLLVGAPHAPADGEQRGFVGIIHASPTIKSGDRLKFDQVIKGQQNYDWFGYSLAAHDQEVYIGSLSHRICARSDCGYDPNDLQAAGQLSYHGNGSTWDAVGPWEFGQLGASVIPAEFAGKNLASGGLTAGSPEDEYNQPGSVFLLDSQSPNTNPVRLTGDRAYARYGQVIQLADLDSDGIKELIVGAPLRTESLGFITGGEEGRLFIYQDGQDPQLVLELTLNESKSRFGSAVAVVQSDNKVELVVSSPFSNSGARLGGSLAVYSFQPEELLNMDSQPRVKLV